MGFSPPAETCRTLGIFFFSSRRRHTRCLSDWSSDVCSSDLRLMTNNPKKIISIRGYGLEVVERVPIELPPTSENADYLRTKRDKLGHLFNRIDEIGRASCRERV